MKATFIGGGAHRLVPTLRAVLDYPEIFVDGEIHLHDIDVSRAEAVGRILRKCPEYRRNPVPIRWGDSLPEALDGASAVGVILMAGTLLSYERGNAESLRHGFWGSDNVSPNGAFLALKGAPILKNIASEMERLCPEAWLLNFANPVAVLSGMLNRHTKIKTLGICAGFTNFQWDLARIFGRNEWRGGDFKVRAAGVNHLSLILDGTHKGRDLFSELDRLVKSGWEMPTFDPPLPELTHAGINRLMQLYRELGILIYSTELDGMLHFFYDEEVRRVSGNIASDPEIQIQVAERMRERRQLNERFASHADRDLDDAFWNGQGHHSSFAKSKDDIFLRILKGVSGLEPADIVTSRLNEGAIAGFADDLVVEYSQRLYKNHITAAGRFTLPPVARGLLHGLAVHQTLLADACHTEDPRLLAHALLAYPIKSFSAKGKELYRSLIAIHGDELPEPLREPHCSLL